MRFYDTAVLFETHLSRFILGRVRSSQAPSSRSNNTWGKFAATSRLRDRTLVGNRYPDYVRSRYQRQRSWNVRSLRRVGKKKPAVDVVPDPLYAVSLIGGLTATSARRDVEVGHPAEDRPKRKRESRNARETPAGRSVAAPSVVLALLRGPRIIASSSLRLVGLDFANIAPKRSSVIRSINPSWTVSRRRVFNPYYVKK